MIASYNGYRSFPQKSTRFSDFYSIFWAKIGCFKWFISHAMHIENEFTLSQTVNSSNPYNLRHWFEVQFSTKRSSYAVYVPHHSGFQSMKLHKWNAKTHTKMWRIWIVKKFCYVHRCLHSENCYWWRDKMIFEEKKNCGAVCEHRAQSKRNLIEIACQYTTAECHVMNNCNKNPLRYLSLIVFHE